MGRISAMESVTLDGVMQGPGRQDEDTRGGFAHGGWAMGFQDEVSSAFMAEGMTGGGAMLFGRRTYEDVLGYWTATESPNPFTEYLTGVRKFVVSRSADTEPAYPNSTLLAGSAVETVGALRTDLDGDLTVLGSGQLVRALHGAGLVDEFVLQIHPILLGSGQRLFTESERSDLVLQRSVATTTGVLIAQYLVRERP